MHNRTLVCILAETRAYKITWPSFKNFVLDPLRADLLLCISVPDNYEFSNPYWQFAKYRFATPEFLDWGDAFDEAQRVESKNDTNLNLPNWRILLDIKDQWLGGIKGPGQHSGSAGILIYYRWYLLKKIESEGLLDKYDRFIVTRSDFIWETAHPPVSHLNVENIWIPDGEGYGGVTDRHVILSKENIISYLKILSPIINDPDTLFSEMRGKDNWNLEQFIDYSLEREGVKSSVRFFPYVMYSAREWSGTTSWSKGQWSDDLGYYIKYRSEFQSAKSASLIIKSTFDWTNFFSKNLSIGFNSRVMDEEENVFVFLGNKIASVNIASLSKESITLSVDYSDRVGFLYLSKHLLGNGEKELIDEVEIIPKGSNSYNLISQKDRAFYAVNSEGVLEKSITNAKDFLFKNKYI